MVDFHAAPPYAGLIGNLFQGEVKEKDTKRQTRFLDNVLTKTSDGMHHRHGPEQYRQEDDEHQTEQDIIP